MEKIVLEIVSIYNKDVSCSKQEIRLKQYKEILKENYLKMKKEERGKIIGQERQVITLTYDGYYKIITTYKKIVTSNGTGIPSATISKVKTI